MNWSRVIRTSVGENIINVPIVMVEDSFNFAFAGVCDLLRCEPLPTFLEPIILVYTICTTENETSRTVKIVNTAVLCEYQVGKLLLGIRPVTTEVNLGIGRYVFWSLFVVAVYAQQRDGDL